MKQLLEKHFGKAWLALVYLFLYVPLFFMIVFSFNSTRQDANFTGFSLRWYEALTRDTKIVEGFWLSVKVAAVTGVLSAILGTFAAFVLVRYRRFLGRTVFSGMVNAPLVMPEVVIGLSLLLLMVGAQNAFGWPERGMLTIIFGHTLLGMAYGALVRRRGDLRIPLRPGREHAAAGDLRLRAPRHQPDHLRRGHAADHHGDDRDHQLLGVGRAADAQARARDRGGDAGRTDGVGDDELIPSRSPRRPRCPWMPGPQAFGGHWMLAPSGKWMGQQGLSRRSMVPMPTFRSAGYCP